jgi:hypothetical protein
MNENNVAFSYYRYSSKNQDKGLSIEGQRDAAEEMALKMGLNIKKEFIVRSTSAKESKNLEPGGEWDTMCKMLKAGDTVLVWGLDRISREDATSVQVQLKRITKEKKARVVLTDGGEIITEDNRENFMEKAKEGKTENDKRGKSISRGLTIQYKMIKRGEPAKLNNLPFWIKKKYNDTGKFIGYGISEERRKVVEYIYQEYLKGKSFRIIAQHLNDDRIPSTHSRPWSGANIHNILRTQRVLGYCTHVEPAVLMWEPVIDRDTWDRVQVLMKEKSSGGGNTAPKKISLTTHLIVCDKCGDFLYRSAGNKKDGGHVYLRCLSRANASGGCAGGVREDKFLKSLQALLVRAGDMKEFVYEDKKPDLYVRLNHLKASLERCEKQIVNATDAILNSGGAASLIKKLKELEIEKSDVQTDIIIEEAAINQYVPAADALKTYQERYNDKFFDAEQAVAIRKVIRDIIDKIVIDITEKTYKVYIKNMSDEPIDVKLDKSSFSINGLAMDYRGNVILTDAEHKELLKEVEMPVGA